MASNQPMSANDVQLSFASSLFVKILTWAWTGANRVVTPAPSMDDTDAITKIFSLMHDPGQFDITFQANGGGSDYSTHLSAAASAGVTFTFSDNSTLGFTIGLSDVSVSGDIDGIVEGSASFAITGAVAHGA